MGALPQSVLFVCTYNAIRSPMAEGLLKSFAGTRCYVQSAGVHAGDVSPMAAGVMSEIGVDVTHHTPKAFENLYDSSFDLVISMTEEARAMAEGWARTHACDLEHWPTPDPSAVEGSRNQRLDAFRSLRDDLGRRIKVRFGLVPDTPPQR